MIQFLSNIIFSLFALGYLPIFLIKLKQAEDPGKLWRERWGNLNLERFPKEKIRIWLHAVSVGEVKAIEPFLEILKNKDFEVFLSTVTPTGQRIAKKNAGAHAFYFPFDLTGPVKKSLESVKPDLILLAETEIWPNFIEEAARRGIPVAVVNGRLSPRSFKRYQWIRFFISKVLEKISFFAMQTDGDTERVRLLGAGSDKALTLGNMKFDSVKEEARESAESLKAFYRVPPSKKVWVAGSTHPGEEQKLFTVFTRLRSTYPDLILISAPRHIERASSVAKLAKEFNFKTRLLSRKEAREDEFDILIVDTIGELKKIYAMADVVFVGGSLVGHGGQNPIEPALYEKPILSGRQVVNFAFVYKVLEDAHGGRMIHSEDELFIGVKEFLNNPAAAQSFGQNALRVIKELSGASGRTADYLTRFVDSAGKAKTS